jgi:hypothetical protein
MWRDFEEFPQKYCKKYQVVRPIKVGAGGASILFALEPEVHENTAASLTALNLRFFTH